MAVQMPILVASALVAFVAVSSVAAFGPYEMGYNGMASAMPAMAASVDSARAAGHALAAENRATDAAIDRATGNPAGAAINENRAIGHQMVSNMAAGRATTEASLAGPAAMGSAITANVAANVANRAVNSEMAGNLPGAMGMSRGIMPPLGPLPYPSYGYMPGYPPVYGGYGALGGLSGYGGYAAGMSRAMAAGVGVGNGAAYANGLAGTAGVPRLGA